MTLVGTDTTPNDPTARHAVAPGMVLASETDLACCYYPPAQFLAQVRVKGMAEGYYFRPYPSEMAWVLVLVGVGASKAVRAFRNAPLRAIDSDA